MKLITVSGPPSSGKTSVMANVIKVLQDDKQRVGVVKFDCLTTDDDKLYQQLDVPVRVGLSGNLCPDHYFFIQCQEDTKKSAHLFPNLKTEISDRLYVFQAGKR